MQTCILYATDFIKILVLIFWFMSVLITASAGVPFLFNSHMEFSLREYSIILCVLLCRRIPECLYNFLWDRVLLAVCWANQVRFRFAAVMWKPSCQVNIECGHIYLLHHFFLSAIQPKLSPALEHTVSLVEPMLIVWLVCEKGCFSFIVIYVLFLAQWVELNCIVISDLIIYCTFLEWGLSRFIVGFWFCLFVMM